MRLRFFMARREVPHSELARYCQIDYEREMTFIALAPPDESGVRQMAGEARAVADPDNRKAEFAMQVASRWQGKGLGRALMEKLLHYLRERGLEEVDGQCLRENMGMAALAKKLGFEVGAGPRATRWRCTWSCASDRAVIAALSRNPSQSPDGAAAVIANSCRKTRSTLVQGGPGTQPGRSLAGRRPRCRRARAGPSSVCS